MVVMEDKSVNDKYKKDNRMSIPEKDKYYTDILREYDTFTAQKNKRWDILKKLEKEDVSKGRKVGVIALVADESSMKASISHRDIPAIGSALSRIGEVDILRLILNSPGGDGVVAEKIVDMCRNYCKSLEIIIPNMAKSAATLMALSADKIVMGYCSEIGPIDAQVPIRIGGIPRYISAQSFINAKQKLHKEFDEAVKAKKDVRVALQQIASLNIPFIEQCEKYMGFSKDMVTKNLSNYMFKKYAEDKEKLKSKIAKVLEALLSTEKFMVHGRMINAYTAKNELDLNVVSLGKDSSYWKKIWEYYVRADIGLGGRRGEKRMAKMIEMKNELLLAG